jgi:hypothetical protein
MKSQVESSKFSLSRRFLHEVLCALYIKNYTLIVREKLTILLEGHLCFGISSTSGDPDFSSIPKTGYRQQFFVFAPSIQASTQTAPAI